MIAFGCGALVLGILFYVFYPERHVEAQTQKTRLEYLRERKEVLYENLRDLNFEYRSGKFVDEDYHAQQMILENEAAGVLAEIELLEDWPLRLRSGQALRRTASGEVGRAPAGRDGQ